MVLQDTIHISIKSSKSEVRQALAQLMHDLQRHAVNEEDRDKVQLVLAETLNNIVEHGYADGQEGPIKLYCTPAPAGLDITVTDRGTEIPRSALFPKPAPDPRTLPGTLPDNLPEGGWGMFLIHSLTETVEYRRHDGRNELRLHLPYSTERPKGTSQGEKS